MLSNENIEKMPNVIQQRRKELNKLVEKYPQKIPTTKAADFLKMDIECFRRAIEQNRLPFALGCNNDKYGNRYSYVSSITFYLWCISPIL